MPHGCFKGFAYKAPNILEKPVTTATIVCILKMTEKTLPFCVHFLSAIDHFLNTLLYNARHQESFFTNEPILDFLQNLAG